MANGLVTVLLLVIATFSRALCDQNASENHRCRRSAEKVLARFSKDRMLHIRNRRGTVEQTSEQFLKAIADIEEYQIQLQRDDLTDLREKELRKSLQDGLLEFCALVGYKATADEAWCGKYRSIDGVCNNKEHPNWGRAGYPYQRLVAPKYKPNNGRPGISQPRWYQSTAREVSRAFTRYGTVDTSTHRASELIMHFGQFVDHDLALTPATDVVCECDTDNPKFCFAIKCADDDPMCGSKGCIPFHRSRPTVNADCTPGPRAQENTITAFVDASNVYGSFDEDAHELRDKSKGLGLMKVDEQPIDEGHIHLLPPDGDNEECVSPGDTVHCGRGGDVRAAEQPGLTSIHTLFVREHNHIATMLHALNEDWGEERLYQEARRIVIAVMQQIVYREWLPLVLGNKTTEAYKLGPWTEYDGYDKEINPTLFNEFAAAFMRFGHSLIPEKLKRVTSLHAHDEFPSIDLRSAFFNAAHVYETEYGSISSLLLGMISTSLLPMDRHFSEAISKHLFEDPLTQEDGIDLIALNIQRGRDHGLPSYRAYRRFCKLPHSDIREWRDLRPIMDDDTIKVLKELYSGPAKIDAFIGYIAEKPKEGALVGETAACILAHQFRNLKFGDRYWFENTAGEQAFTHDQIQAIKNVTMARIICDNIRVESIQPAVFKVPDREGDNGGRTFVDILLKEVYPDGNGKLKDFSNHRVACSDFDKIPELSLSAWSDCTKNE